MRQEVQWTLEKVAVCVYHVISKFHEHIIHNMYTNHNIIISSISFKIIIS